MSLTPYHDDVIEPAPPRSGLRIKDVRTVIVNADLRNWVFVKVVTDDPALVGWGEATLEWKARAVAGALEDLRPLVVGADPFAIEHLWQAMYRQHFFQGGVVTMSAISGVDQALHDIKAKALGVPVYELLGGAVRRRVRMYDHLAGGASKVVYGRPTPQGFAEAARESVAAGFSALKILPVPIGPALVGAAELRNAERLMAAVRDAVGDDVDVMVDFHGRTTPAMAVQYGAALLPHRPWFIEEPCRPGDAAAMAEVASKLDIPIATGERLVDLRDIRDHLAARACAVLQPDVCHVGGLTAMRKIAALADMHQVAVAPHNPLGPIATAMNLHFAFATPNFLIQEVMRADVAWRDDVVAGSLPIVDGHATLPTAPGLGVEVDEKAAARHPYRQEPQLQPATDDGAVADW